VVLVVVFLVVVFLAVIAALDLGADPDAEDLMGNTGEELASFDGRTDIQNVIFERRMKQRFHVPLAEWALDPSQLANSEQAEWFVTEYLGGHLSSEEERDTTEDKVIAGQLLHLPEDTLESTCIPNLSSRAESALDKR